ncbi:MAG TPA: acyltransferase family protein [Acidimicrobiales bacterium]|nr:acyltransferase family protein [Acidimicrobiales bacterium]
MNSTTSRLAHWGPLWARISPPERDPSPATGVRTDGPGPVMPRLPAIDGLRAVAVTAVLLYHLPVGWLPGGFLGVDVFFVISGFLITSILTAEAHRTGGVSLGNFWLRRARRLLPALLVMVVVVVAVSAIFARDALSLLASDLPAVLGYFTNWWLVFHHVSYFQSVGRPPLVLHLWSLAVEEQFYLLWPLIVVLVLRRHTRTALIGWIAIAGAVLSSAWMAILFQTSQDPSRVYFGTDTHAGGLLLGAALAIAFPPWNRSRTVSRSARRLMGGVGWAAFAGLVALMATLNQFSTFTYRGGLQLATVVSAVIILVVTHPALRGAQVLATPVLQWIGKRSYAIYLWHWPIFELTRPDIDVSLSGWPLTALRLALVAVAADLSFRLVEQPLRTGAVQSVLRRLWAQRPRISLATGGGVALVLALLTVELTTAPAIVAPPALASGATPAGRTRIIPTGDGVPATRASGQQSSAPVPPTPVSVVPTTSPADDVLAVGDSVMLDAAPDLAQDLGPSTVVDAVVGRQVSDGIARLADYRAAGRLSSLTALVIGLGTNGPMSIAQCDQILSQASGIPRVIFVNVRMPRPWESVTNDTLAACTAHQPRVFLVDWFDASAAPGVLGPDEIHSTPAGATLYASLVARAAIEVPAGVRPELARR